MIGDRGIYFGSGIDTTDFHKQVEEMKKDILSITKEGEKVDLSAITDQIKLQKDVIKGLEKDYANLGKVLENAVPGKAKNKLLEEHKKIGVAIEAEKQSLKALDEVYKDFAKEQANLRIRQRALRHELYALAEAGKANTKEYQELFAELRKLDKAIDSVKALQNTMRGTGVSMQVITGSLRAGVGAFTTITGVMSGLADQNERFAEIQTRLQTVMTISIGIEQTYNSLLKEGRLVQAAKALQLRAAAKAQDLSTRSTIQATVAQRAFNLVAKANPYVLLAGLILSVVGALALFTKKNKEATDQLAEMNKKIADSVAEPMTQIRLLQEQWKLLGSDEEKNKWIEKNKSSFNALGMAIENTKDAENAFVNRTDVVIKAMQLRAKAAAMEKISQDLYQDYLKQMDEVDRQLAPQSDNFFKRTAQGIAAGWTNIWDKVFDREQPIDKAEKALSRYNQLIEESAKLTIEADRLIAELGLSPGAGKDKEKKEKEEREKTFQEELEERKRLWANYYEAIRQIGKEAADEIYKDEIKGYQSLLDELTKRRNEMLTKGISSTEQAAQLNLLSQAIRDLTGQQSPFEKYKKDIEGSLNSIESFSARIKFLKSEMDKLGDTPEDFQIAAYLREQTDKIVQERQRMFDDLMAAHESYEEKVRKVSERTAELLKLATTPEEIKIIEDEDAKKKLDLYIEHLKNSYEDLNKVFSDINSLTIDQLVKFREIFVQELEAANDIAKKNEIAKIIRNIDKAIARLNSNPLKDLANDIKDLFNTQKGSSERNTVLASITKNIDLAAREVVKPIDDITQAAVNLGVEADDAFMKLLGGMKNFVSGARDIGVGAAGILSGNPLSMIQGVTTAIRGVSSIFSTWIKQSKEQESQFERVTKKIEGMRRAYELLEKTINAVGDQSNIRAQQKLIGHLQSQAAFLESEIDQYKRIASSTSFRGGPEVLLSEEYKQLVADLAEVNRQISEIVDDITDEIFTSGAKDLAAQLGDALVDAFERGEDAAESMRDVVNNVVRDMVRRMVTSALMPRVQDVFDNVLRDMGINPETGLPISNRDGFSTELTKEQIQKFKNDLNDVAEFGEDIIANFGDLLNEILDLSKEEDRDGLRGAIKGMTQETADILAGQFNAIRIDTSQIVSILKRGESRADAKIIHLANIDTNTSNTVKELRELNSKIKEGDIRSSGL